MLRIALLPLSRVFSTGVGLFNVKNKVPEKEF